MAQNIMDDIPKVSVIIPCYNSEKFIRETLESVFSQTLIDFEVIIVDDGSKDKTKDLISSFADKRIKYIYKENNGMAAARNTGIEDSKGEYIAFLDHDDIWLPNKLELQLNEIKKSDDIGLIYTGYIIINDGGVVLEERRPVRSGRILKNLLIEGNIVGTPSCVMVKKSVFDKVSLFDPSLSISADWDLWIRIAACYRIEFIDKILTKYRVHEKSFHKNLYIYERDSIVTLRRFFKNYPHNHYFGNIKRIALGNAYAAAAGSYFKIGRYLSFLRAFFILLFLYPEALFIFLFRKLKKR